MAHVTIFLDLTFSLPHHGHPHCLHRHHHIPPHHNQLQHHWPPSHLFKKLKMVILMAPTTKKLFSCDQHHFATSKRRKKSHRSEINAISVTLPPLNLCNHKNYLWNHMNNEHALRCNATFVILHQFGLI